MKINSIIDLVKDLDTSRQTKNLNKLLIRILLHLQVEFSKDKKEFTADMKNIYNAPNKEVAAAELNNLERKWGGKYPYAILSWRNNWDDLTVFFQFPLEIRK